MIPIFSINEQNSYMHHKGDVLVESSFFQREPTSHVDEVVNKLN